MLKAIYPKVATIEIEYSIFDPSDDFQVVHLVVNGPAQIQADGSDPDKSIHVLNKNDSKYIIRDLDPDTSYSISLTYYKVGSSEETVEDTVIATTKPAGYNIKVNKITVEETIDPTYGQVVKQYFLHYELTVDNQYKFTSANIRYHGYNRNESTGLFGDISQDAAVQPIEGASIGSDGIYTGVIALNAGMSLADKNVVLINDIKFCAGYSESELANCPTSDYTYSYKFFSE